MKNMPPNRRLIDSKWVFKQKIDVQFRAHLVSRGYNQIPGVDFIKNYSLVVTYVTLQHRRELPHSTLPQNNGNLSLPVFGSNYPIVLWYNIY